MQGKWERDNLIFKPSQLALLKTLHNLVLQPANQQSQG